MIEMKRLSEELLEYFSNTSEEQLQKIGKLYTASMLMDLKSINLLKNVKRMPYTMKL